MRMPWTDATIMKIVKRAQQYDISNRPPMESWSRVPDDQVIRLLIGAGLIKVPDP